MTVKKPGDKGRETEELVRSYFLRAGFFVVRGIKLRVEGAELTDVDLWVYERSTTLARRRTVVDIKDKAKPQAAERFFFIKGLAEVIGVEGAGVVTTDSRPILRKLAARNKILWIDGNDLQRLKKSPELSSPGRITEEDLGTEAATIDLDRGTKQFLYSLDRVKSAVGDRFGAASANTALEEVQSAARVAVASHPDSAVTRLAGRIVFLSSAIAAASLDFASAETALRPVAERHQHISNALRFGADADGTFEKLQWAEAAIQQYAPGGGGLARVVREKFLSDFQTVPSEDLAEIVIRLAKTEALFNVAKALERAAYAERLPTFDALDIDSRTFLGAVLDFVQVERVKFANAWSPPSTQHEASVDTKGEGAPATTAEATQPEPEEKQKRLI